MRWFWKGVHLSETSRRVRAVLEVPGHVETAYLKAKDDTKYDGSKGAPATRTVSINLSFPEH